MKVRIVGNAVSGNRLVRQRIENRCRAGKVPRSLRQRRYAEEVGKRLAHSLPIIVQEKESTVLYDRASPGSAELVLLEWWSGAGQGEKILGIKYIVAHKFVEASVRMIGPGLCHDVDYTARFASKLGVVVGLVDHELGDIIGRWIQDEIVEIFVRHAHPIHQK